MRVFLETDRLALRRFTEADEDNLFELNSDPEVMRFLNGGPTPRDEVRTRIIPTFLGYYERFDGFGFWAAAEIATGQFLGWFHFRPPLRAADTPAGWDEVGVAELRLSAAPGRLGGGLRDRGVPGPDRQGLYRVRRAACSGGDAGGYLDAAPADWVVRPSGIQLTFHSEHRPIEAYSRALEAAGLLIEAIRETGRRTGSPDAPGHRRWQRIPLFLHLRAVKPAGART